MESNYELEACAIDAMAKLVDARDHCRSQMDDLENNVQHVLKKYESYRRRSSSLPGKPTSGNGSESEDDLVARVPTAINAKKESVKRKSRNHSVPAFRPKSASESSRQSVQGYDQENELERSSRNTRRMTHIVTWPVEEMPISTRKNSSRSQRSSRQSDPETIISSNYERLNSFGEISRISSKLFVKLIGFYSFRSCFSSENFKAKSIST